MPSTSRDLEECRCRSDTPLGPRSLSGGTLRLPAFLHSGFELRGGDLVRSFVPFRAGERERERGWDFERVRGRSRYRLDLV